MEEGPEASMVRYYLGHPERQTTPRSVHPGFQHWLNGRYDSLSTDTVRLERFFPCAYGCLVMSRFETGFYFRRYLYASLSEDLRILVHLGVFTCHQFQGREIGQYRHCRSRYCFIGTSCPYRYHVEGLIHFRFGFSIVFQFPYPYRGLVQGDGTHCVGIQPAYPTACPILGRSLLKALARSRIQRALSVKWLSKFQSLSKINPRYLIWEPILISVDSTSRVVLGGGRPFSFLSYIKRASVFLVATLSPARYIELIVE